MSSPETAPAGDDSAVEPSVEGEAPDGASEVGDGNSEVPDGFIEKARFNGLMGRFNQEQSAKQKLEAELDELRTELESLRVEASKETQSVSDEDLKSEVAALRDLLLEERREAARNRALEKYPEAKAFADLIVGNSPEDFEDMAREVSERIRGLAPSADAGTGDSGEASDESGTGGEAAGDSTTNSDEGGSTEPPVAGGAATFTGAGTVQDRVAEAVKAGDFGALLRAKLEGVEAGAYTPLA